MSTSHDSADAPANLLRISLPLRRPNDRRTACTKLQQHIVDLSSKASNLRKGRFSGASFYYLDDWMLHVSILSKFGALDSIQNSSEAKSEMRLFRFGALAQFRTDKGDE